MKGVWCDWFLLINAVPFTKSYKLTEQQWGKSLSDSEHPQLRRPRTASWGATGQLLRLPPPSLSLSLEPLGVTAGRIKTPWTWVGALRWHFGLLKHLVRAHTAKYDGAEHAVTKLLTQSDTSSENKAGRTVGLDSWLTVGRKRGGRWHSSTDVCKWGSNGRWV